MKNDVTVEHLQDLAGRKMDEDTKESPSSFEQEDLLIFFAEKLFTSSKFYNPEKN